MSTDIRIENVKIFVAERLNNSVNGNPRYRFYTDHGTFLMQNDASMGYAVENFTRPLRDNYAIGDNAPAVTLLATRASRVWGIEKNGVVLR